MEFGPRALGARSILGDPGRPDTQTTMNLRIKFRESFRPFAPSVLEEEAPAHFELDVASPYMLLVADVRPEHRLPFDRSGAWVEGDDMLPVIARARSHLPAIPHVDYSARIQTVDAGSHEAYRRVLDAVRRRTGFGVVVNTSFNVRGEPIVCTPAEAYQCFMRTEMEMLVLEDCVLRKTEQPRFDEDEGWKSRLLSEDEGRSAEGSSGPSDPLRPAPEDLAEIRRIWHEDLAPLVGHGFFPRGPDATRATYYRAVSSPAGAAPAIAR